MKNLLSIILLISGMLVSLSATSQSNASTPYELAREYLDAGNYPEAIEFIEKALWVNPHDYDLLILEPIAYSRMSKNDSAINKIERMVLQWPANEEVLALRIRIYYWAGEYKEAINKIELLKRKPKLDIFQIKMNCLIESGQEERALAEIKKSQRYLSQSETLKAQYRELRNKLFKNSFEINYNYSELMQSNDYWQYVSVGYMRKTKLGKINPYITYGNLAGDKGLRYDLDLHPVFSKKTYGYFNVGYSQAKIFPDWKFAGELFQVLPHKFEVSAGIRSYNLENSWINNYTSSLTKYFGNYSATYRAFVTDYRSDLSTTHLIQFKRYLRSGYLEITASKGRTLDVITTIEDVQNLKVTMASFGYHYQVTGSTQIRIEGYYFHEKLSEAVQRNRINFVLGLEKSF